MPRSAVPPPGAAPRPEPRKVSLGAAGAGGGQRHGAPGACVRARRRGGQGLPTSKRPPGDWQRRGGAGGGRAHAHTRAHTYPRAHSRACTPRARSERGVRLKGMILLFCM
ncbi:uncharacterized protein LOC124417180 [Gallus gallus]|uniref:uncharacterized protein LOC124417180 n=1 Tax=Gallus gallus TaxID=9031 RepID=UPI001F0315F3|nr:uncharacterized protein LOC124417180 [Gallus gallus]XP_046783168.1 uncharacterized protein LOC124417180 [Gallus gallus]